MKYLKKYGLSFEDLKEIESVLDDMDLNLLYVNEDKVISILDYLISIGFTNVKELLMHKTNLFYIRLSVKIGRASCRERV